MIRSRFHNIYHKYKVACAREVGLCPRYHLMS